MKPAIRVLAAVALVAAWVGYTFHLPWYIHLPLALVGGILGGALWAAIPGYLKAATGAHEVVNTIMMNYIAFRLSDWLLRGPMMATGFRPVTPVIDSTAALPRLFDDPLRFNIGFFLALLVALFIYWLLFKTTLGFEIRSVGANPHASKYAGMNVTGNFILAMVISGGLAGLGGAVQVLGTDLWVGQGFSAGYGFDSLAVALLGNSHPLGVVLAALLFGTMRSGARSMSSLAGIPIDIVSIIQGLVIIFVAAPAIIRWLYRIRAAREEMLREAQHVVLRAARGAETRVVERDSHGAFSADVDRAGARADPTCGPAGWKQLRYLMPAAKGRARAGRFGRGASGGRSPRRVATPRTPSPARTPAPRR